MNSFLKQVLATVVGFFCIGIFMLIMGTVMMLSVIALGNQKPTLDDKTVLRVNLNGTLTEQAQENPFAELMGNSAMTEQGLDDLLKAIKTAKTNDKISGIYLEGGVLSADFASLEELRKALLDFKKSKKFVVAYADNYMQGTYYLASVADKVLINPEGMLDWHGIASQPIFFKELLEKVGVKMQVFRVGTYKSYVEPYTRTEMSDANREQVHSFISDIWNNVCKDVAASRHIKAEALNSFADRYMALTKAPEYVKLGLVDSLTYIDGTRDCLRRLAGTEKVKFISPSALAKLSEAGDSDNKVAVYYAFGGIVGAEQSGGLNQEAQIVGPKVVEDMDRLMNDENVKAVVLRINSGGGSAYASEQMWHAIQQLRKKKPVVVSMGGMAASGGYYMACGADYIFAEPTTLTGSIGIFGMVPDATGLLTDKLGLHFDVVKTNEASDFGAMGRPFSAAETAAMQNYVERGYSLFLKRVAAGRKMKPEAVDRIAQGRVWTGSQALKIKLVDRLGTLDDAVAEAARRAGLKEYAVTEEPGMSPWLDRLMKTAQGGDYLEQQLRATLGVYYQPLRFVKGLQGTDCLQARIPFEPNLN